MHTTIPGVCSSLSPPFASPPPSWQALSVHNEPCGQFSQAPFLYFYLTFFLFFAYFFFVFSITIGTFVLITESLIHFREPIHTTSLSLSPTFSSTFIHSQP